MGTRKLLIFALLTAAVVVMATFASRRERRDAQAATGGHLFPSLVDQVNDVTRIRIRQGEESVTLQRTGDTWGLADKDDYPVEFTKVKSDLMGLANLETLEAKTRNPERFGDLGLRDPGSEDSRAKLVELENASGQQIASLLIGESAVSRSGASQVYVRKTGDLQTWLAKADLDLPLDGMLWIAKEVIKLPRTDVRATRVRHADGEELFLSRDSRDETAFNVRDVPEGRELSYASVGNTVAGALEYLSLEDVRAADSVEWPEEPATVTEFWTFDKLHVTARFYEIDGRRWVRFEAAFDPENPPGLGDVAPKDESAETPNKPAQPTPQEPAEVEAEAAKIDARVGRWAYLLPEASVTALTKRIDGLLKPLPTLPAPGEEGDAQGNGDQEMRLEDILSPEQLQQLREQGAQFGDEDESDGN